jgi:3-oxoacyl-[acyl-carrier-protein] synthase III
MDGKAVRELMVEFVGGPGTQAALHKAGLSLEHLDLVTLHEANRVLNGDIITRWKEQGFRGNIIDAGGNFGNTTSASIPLALALNPDALQVGKRFGLFGFGGGLSACFAFGQITSPIEVVTEL